MRESFERASKGIIRHDDGDHRVIAITDQESDKVIIGIGETDVSAINRWSVPNIDVVFLPSKNKGIADGAMASKVEKVSVDLIAGGTRTSTNGGKVSVQLCSVGSQWTAVPKRIEKVGIAAMVKV